MAELNENKKKKSLSQGNLTQMFSPFKRSQKLARSPTTVGDDPIEILSPAKNDNMSMLLTAVRQLMEFREEISNELGTIKKSYNDLLIKLNKQDEPPKVEFSTDEDELAKETEWVRVSNVSKKRKISLSPPQQNVKNKENQGKISAAKISVRPPQQYGKNKENLGKISAVKTQKALLPPPIILESVNNYNELNDSVKGCLQDEPYNVKLMGKTTIKINVESENAYRQLVKLVETKCWNWHSYENKQKRPIRVMAKKLHHSCDANAILTDLKSKGLRIISATNKLSWRDKNPLDMFVLSFEAEQNIDKIYEIKDILKCKVEIEAIKTPKFIPQCKKCQGYGHTQNYCGKEPRCVKCAGKHSTTECKKSASSAPKCLHCGEAHPANYRGCAVAKQLQLLRNKKTQTAAKKILSQNENTDKKLRAPKFNPNINVDSYSKPRISYAQVTAGLKPTTVNSAVAEDFNQTIQQTLQEILTKLNNQEVINKELNIRLTKIEMSVRGTRPKTHK